MYIEYKYIHFPLLLGKGRTINWIVVSKYIYISKTLRPLNNVYMYSRNKSIKNILD